MITLIYYDELLNIASTNSTSQKIFNNFMLCFETHFHFDIKSHFFSLKKWKEFQSECWQTYILLHATLYKDINDNN